MSEWKEYRFSDLLIDESISYGIVQPGSHKEYDSIPIIRVNNIKDGSIQTNNILKVDKEIERKYQRTKLHGGELLITVVGSVGECAIVSKSFAGWNVARAVSVARFKNDFDIHFVKYSFKTDDILFQMYGNTNDTVQPTLNLSELKSIKFNIPSLPEQRAIATILSCLDDKIDLLHRQNKTLEAMAEALFRQWFVEFNFPNFDGELVDGIPKGWIVLDLGSVSTLIAGGDKPKNFSTQQNELFKIPIYSNGITNEGLYGFTDLPRVSEESVTVSARGTIGYVCLRVKPFVPIVRLIAVIPNQKFISAKYIYFWLKNEKISGTGTTQQQLTVPDFKISKVLVPNIELINKFTLVVNSLFQKIEENIYQIRTLTQLRDTLLPKLMSGEVRVIS